MSLSDPPKWSSPQCWRRAQPDCEKQKTRRFGYAKRPGEVKAVVRNDHPVGNRIAVLVRDAFNPAPSQASTGFGRHTRAAFLGILNKNIRVVRLRAAEQCKPKTKSAERTIGKSTLEANRAGNLIAELSASIADICAPGGSVALGAGRQAEAGRTQVLDIKPCKGQTCPETSPAKIAFERKERVDDNCGAQWRAVCNKPNP